MNIEWVGRTPALAEIIESVLLEAAAMEGLPENIQLSVTCVNDAEMERLNADTRGVARPTDVLSFPTVRYKPQTTAKDNQKRVRREIDPDTGHYMLGDIVINEDRIAEQAEKFGHSIERETAYLIVHGFLHLLGYDHELDIDKKKMRAIEESALLKASLDREADIGDDRAVNDMLLIQAAKRAMQNAYVPYSGYRVGACLLTAGGRMFTGCNIENASYGLTSCAERTAVYKAVSEGSRQFIAIAIAAEGSMPYPCGACRQVLNEFAPDLRVIVACGDSVEEHRLSELLPYGFSAGNL